MTFSFQAEAGPAKPCTSLSAARQYSDRQFASGTENEATTPSYAECDLLSLFSDLLMIFIGLDKLGDDLVKDTYLGEATTLMNQADPSYQGALFFLTRGILQLAKQSTMNEALVTFDGVLASSPTNLVALHGKVWLLPFTLTSCTFH